MTIHSIKHHKAMTRQTHFKQGKEANLAGHVLAVAWFDVIRNRRETSPCKRPCKLLWMGVNIHALKPPKAPPHWAVVIQLVQIPRGHIPLGFWLCGRCIKGTSAEHLGNFQVTSSCNVNAHYSIYKKTRSVTPTNCHINHQAKPTKPNHFQNPLCPLDIWLDLLYLFFIVFYCFSIRMVPQQKQMIPRKLSCLAAAKCKDKSQQRSHDGFIPGAFRNRSESYWNLGRHSCAKHMQWNTMEVVIESGDVRQLQGIHCIKTSNPSWHVKTCQDRRLPQSKAGTYFKILMYI